MFLPADRCFPSGRVGRTDRVTATFPRINQDFFPHELRKTLERPATTWLFGCYVALCVEVCDISFWKDLFSCQTVNTIRPSHRCSTLPADPLTCRRRFSSVTTSTSRPEKLSPSAPTSVTVAQNNSAFTPWNRQLPEQVKGASKTILKCLHDSKHPV